SGGGRRPAGAYSSAAERPATTENSLENILSLGRHEVVSATAASALAEVDHDRTMVLERGGRSRRAVSRSVEEICLRAISRSAQARAESQIRTGDAHKS